jgi:hypothetical protein
MKTCAFVEERREREQGVSYPGLTMLGGSTFVLSSNLHSTTATCRATTWDLQRHPLTGEWTAHHSLTAGPSPQRDHLLRVLGSDAVDAAVFFLVDPSLQLGPYIFSQWEFDNGVLKLCTPQPGVTRDNGPPWPSPNGHRLHIVGRKNELC